MKWRVLLLFSAFAMPGAVSSIDSRTAIMIVCQMNDEGVVHELATVTEDQDRRNTDGKTAYEYALRNLKLPAALTCQTMS